MLAKWPPRQKKLRKTVFVPALTDLQVLPSSHDTVDVCWLVSSLFTSFVLVETKC